MLNEARLTEHMKVLVVLPPNGNKGFTANFGAPPKPKVAGSAGTPATPGVGARRVDVTGRLDIEIEGARQIRANFPNSLHVFVLPPSADVLVGRLTGRKTEPVEVIRERVSRAADELTAVSEYDYALVNEELVVARQTKALLEGK